MLSLKEEIIYTLSELKKLQQERVECIKALDCPNITNHNHVYAKCIEPGAKCQKIHEKITEIDKQLLEKKVILEHKVILDLILDLKV